MPWLLVISVSGTRSVYHVESYYKSDSLISVRNAHAMAYHSKESRVYLFGGADEKEVLSDLWILEGSHWRKVVSDCEPGPRTFASMVYDSENDRLLLFGGSRVLFGGQPDSQSLLNDTWEFSDSEWRKIASKSFPPTRAEAAMAYDEARKRVVLFGGYRIQDGNYSFLGDTWEFYDNEWHFVTENGPSKRHGAAMAYDAENRTILLFGGGTVDHQYGENSGETWRWCGEKWSKLEIEQPPGVFNASMVYNKERNELFRFGGWNGRSRINELWLFCNLTWNKVDVDNGPLARNHSAIAYDEFNKRIILFGGHDGENVFGDLWQFKYPIWEKLSEIQPMTRVKNGH